MLRVPGAKPDAPSGAGVNASWDGSMSQLSVQPHARAMLCQ